MDSLINILCFTSLHWLYYARNLLGPKEKPHLRSQKEPPHLSVLLCHLFHHWLLICFWRKPWRDYWCYQQLCGSHACQSFVPRASICVLFCGISGHVCHRYWDYGWENQDGTNDWLCCVPIIHHTTHYDGLSLEFARRMAIIIRLFRQRRLCSNTNCWRSRGFDWCSGSWTSIWKVHV